MHKSSPVRRRPYGLIGLILLAISQYLILRDTPVPYNLFTFFSRGWQYEYSFDISNLDNTLLALVALGVGSLFVWRSFPTSAGAPSPPPVPDSAPRAEPYLRRDWWLIGVALLLWGWTLFQIAGGNYSSMVWGPWLAAIGLLTSTCVRSDTRRSVPLSLGLDRTDYVWLIELVLFGLAIGTYHLQTLPAAFVPDEWSFWSAARDIARGTYRPILLGFGVYSYPVLSSLYQGALIALFGESVWSWRFSAVLASIAAVPPTYVLAKSLFNRQIACMSGLVIIAMPYFVAFARLGYNNTQSIAPVVLTLLFLYISTQRDSMLYPLLAGFAAGAGFYTYTAGRLGLLVAMLWLGSSMLEPLAWPLRSIDKALFARTLRHTAWLMSIILVGWAVIALPHTVYGMVSDPRSLSYKLLESLFPNVFYGRTLFYDDQLFRTWPLIQVGEQQFFFSFDLYARLIMRGFMRTFLAFHHDTIVQQHFVVGPLPGPTLVIPAWCGFLLALFRWREVSYRLLAIWALSGVLLLSVFNTFPPRQAHLVAIIPALAIFSALGLNWCAEIVAQPFALWRRRVRTTVIASSILIATGVGLFSYFIAMPQRYPPTPEDTMNTYAIALDQPAQMLYVTSDMQLVGFVPTAIQEMRTAAHFQTIVCNYGCTALQSTDLRQPVVVFARPQDAPIAETWLGRWYGFVPQPQPLPVPDTPVLLEYVIPRLDTKP